MTAQISYSRHREQVEAVLPANELDAISYDDIAAKTGISPEKAATCCRALRKFGAAKCRKSDRVENFNRRILWWRVQ
jgi:hypothetical protein